ncbi:MAG: CHAT domain-containing protein, partial [Actinomycetota bacterium]|nr:CHAT domain-containing protein [Actinomycetota bacterium]
VHADCVVPRGFCAAGVGVVPVTWAVGHARALAWQERGSPLRAKPYARAAIASATTPGELAESRLVLAWISHQLGEHETASDLIHQARPDLSGTQLPRADCLWGLTLCATADHNSALSALTSAAARLRDDPHWRANALVGAGIAAGYLRRFEVADTMFAEAHTLYTTQGEPDRAATCLHNRGFVAAQAGDPPRALTLYQLAGVDERRYPEVLIDKASAMLGAGMVGAAGATLARAAILLGAAGRGPAFAEATLAYARCLLRKGALDEAAAAARTAGELFGRQHRDGWTAVARAVELRARADPQVNGEVLEVAASCANAGWLIDAAELLLTVGRPDLVERYRHTDDAALRALGWLASARMATTRRAVLGACRNGLRSADEQVAPRLAETGLDAAVDTARPRTIFAWSERQRSVAKPSVPAEIAGTLGDTVLLSFFVHKGQLGVISIANHRWHRHAIAAVDHVDEAAEALSRAAFLAARTMAVPTTPAAARLDDILLKPLRGILQDRPMVVIPTSHLAGVPWAALPACFNRPVSVVPSAQSWLTAARNAPPEGESVWIAGPGLDHADREVAALHRTHGGRLLDGPKSTVDNVVAAMAGAPLVHIAAHGRHRVNAPLYSHLTLADGKLHAHDLAKLPRPPHRIVLSSCESARGFLGLAAILLNRGTSTVIASTLPVPDAGAGDLMLALHANLSKGLPAADALARAQAVHGHLGFVNVGAG